jgi:hypothetical protein
MTVSAFPLLNGIVPVRFFEADRLETVAGFAKLRFLLYKIFLILRAVSIMADKASVGQRLVLFYSHKSILFMAYETLLASGFLLQILIVGGMRAMTGKTFTLS